MGDLLDVGLLGAMAKTEATHTLISNQAFTEYKGGLTEQYVFQQMKSHGIDPNNCHVATEKSVEMA